MKPGIEYYKDMVKVLQHKITKQRIALVEKQLENAALRSGQKVNDWKQRALRAEEKLRAAGLS